MMFAGIVIGLAIFGALVRLSGSFTIAFIATAVCLAAVVVAPACVWPEAECADRHGQEEPEDHCQKKASPGAAKRPPRGRRHDRSRPRHLCPRSAIEPSGLQPSPLPIWRSLLNGIIVAAASRRHGTRTVVAATDADIHVGGGCDGSPFDVRFRVRTKAASPRWPISRIGCVLASLRGPA